MTDLENELNNVINPKRNSYQQFDKNSQSGLKSIQKLDKLGILENLTGKTVLDLGSNEGFFSFQCEKYGAKVTGIEHDKYWYDLAQKRKNELSSTVNFVNDNWSIIPTLHIKFDLVLFLAAFHYIKNNQLEILKNIFNKMNENGVLILEVGLLDKDEGKFLIEDVKRPTADVCQFTNKFTMIKLLEDAGFKNIIFYGHGMKVPGDNLPRYVIHANKFEGNSSGDSKITKEKQKSEELETPSTDEINLHEVENLLLTLYNRNSFFRIFFKFGYKILKIFSKT